MKGITNCFFCGHHPIYSALTCSLCHAALPGRSKIQRIHLTKTSTRENRGNDQERINFNYDTDVKRAGYNGGSDDHNPQVLTVEVEVFGVKLQLLFRRTEGNGQVQVETYASAKQDGSAGVRNAIL